MPTQRSIDALRGWSYWREATLLTTTSWREMYARGSILRNLAAGLTIAVVALPLNLALAIFCGLPPSVGLLTGAIAGALCAFLGGARLQVSGPEVALAPVTLLIVKEHGFDGLLVATFLAGLFQISFGFLRLGRYVALLPRSVTIGFLVAVGVLVFDSQLPRLLGLPAEITFLRHATSADIASGTSWPIALIGLSSVLVIVLSPRLLPRVPGPLMGLVVGVSLALLIRGVPTVDAFELTFPHPRLPDFGALHLSILIPEAFALALIASIDSLLCALSVDARTGGPKTRADQELVAQGLANMACASLGAMPVAAAVVRSMAAVEAGATTRLAPLAQAFLLGLVMLVLGHAVSYVPLVALASVLLVVGYRLLEFRSLRRLWMTDRSELLVVAATAVGIIASDFVIGVAIGVAAALLQFAAKQNALFHVEQRRAPDSPTHSLLLTGPLFFGTQSRLDSRIDSIEPGGRVVVDLSGITILDDSGNASLLLAIERLASKVEEVWLHGAPAGHDPSFATHLVARIQSDRVSIVPPNDSGHDACEAPLSASGPARPVHLEHAGLSRRAALRQLSAATLSSSKP